MQTKTWLIAASVIALAGVSAVPSVAADDYANHLVTECAVMDQNDLGSDQVAYANCAVFGTPRAAGDEECGLVPSIQGTIDNEGSTESVAECLP